MPGIIIGLVIGVFAAFDGGAIEAVDQKGFKEAAKTAYVESQPITKEIYETFND